jgi:hypothetical protein
MKLPLSGYCRQTGFNINFVQQQWRQRTSYEKSTDIHCSCFCLVILVALDPFARRLAEAASDSAANW